MKLGNIAQDHKATNTGLFLYHDVIKNIPADKKISYAHIIVDYIQVTKTWSKQSQNHSWRKPHQIFTWSYNMNSRPCYYQDTLEQCCQYPKCKERLYKLLP